MATEISYIIPGVLAVASAGPTHPLRVQFPVAPTHYYELQSSTNLSSWSDIWVTPVETSNAWVEFDPPVLPTINEQFFRLILH